MTKRKSIKRPEHDYLCSNGWQTPDTYGGEFSPIPCKPGVYVFLSVHIPMSSREEWVDRVSYVGMSQNLKRRITGHEVLRLETEWCMRWFKVFDETSDELRIREAELIKFFQPTMNIIGKQKSVSDMLGYVR